MSHSFVATGATVRQRVAIFGETQS